MTLWTRSAPLDAAAASQQEIWSYAPEGRARKDFLLEVTSGKPLDAAALKNTPLEELRAYAAKLAETAERLYGDPGTSERVTHCPCCAAPAETATEALRVFAATYRRCAVCGHVFVSPRPVPEVMNAVFASSEEHSQLYVDHSTLDIRLSQVIEPKLDWTLKAYEAAVGGAPTNCLDVGAGGGHFVEGLRRRGFDAEGYELSRSSRAFAQEAFGVRLREEDFLTSPPKLRDLITMWGLLEYTPNPRDFLARARENLKAGEGLLIVEVPRFDALGTVVQAENPKGIARHMDPTSHLNCFSDSSLATALVEEGFRPIAVWYFGLDAYELAVQISLRLAQETLFERLADMIPAIQAACDAGRQCDDIIMAAVPE